MAQALRAHSEELVTLADDETALGKSRLDTELVRTAFQIDFFAELIDSGQFLRELSDRADPNWPSAPRPSLTRLHVPIGVVAVFAASNFPFAFSVAGGDTASALAAGCPVVVKAHSGHPRLSQRVADICRESLIEAGMPPASLTLVRGREVGRQLVEDNRVDAVAFTGSTEGGRALFDIACGRPRPIPFYGELGSVNPVFVTARAAETDSDRIWRELTASFTLSAGQLCTKPGIVFAPRTADAPSLILEYLDCAQRWELLDERIAEGFAAQVNELAENQAVHVIASSPVEGRTAGPWLLKTDIASFLAAPHALINECFGPAVLIVEYHDESDLLTAAACFTGELTATIQAHADDDVVPALVRTVTRRAGRIVWNQWPTGVAVTGAMQHGGPYPSSTSARDTSVGAAAAERFLRPVTYQNFPARVIPL